MMIERIIKNKEMRDDDFINFSNFYYYNGLVDLGKLDRGILTWTHLTSSYSNKGFDTSTI